ncbi:MAG: SEL1-like repeat protein [Gemmatimonadetes bacterium]|nr:SEL1-like repeat protein [Gemmatimonadota bacterium]
MTKVPVLFLSADPTGTLSLQEDLRSIQVKVRAAEYRDALHFDIRPAARLDDVVQALYETRPRIVHFSGHGCSDGLMFVGTDGHTPQWASVEDLTELFTAFRGEIGLVVLSACSTGVQARAIADVVGCAIGTPARIADEAAIAFNAEFYRALAFGESVEGARAKTCAVLALNGLDTVRPEVAAGPGVDPGELIIVPRRRWWPAVVSTLLLLCVVAFTGLRGSGGDEPLVPPPPAPPEAFAAAVELHRVGNYAASFPLFKIAAEAGNPEAMGFVGSAFLHGQGTERTPELAAHWLAQAADKRDGRGMNAYGLAYEEGFGVAQSYYHARQWYQAAAAEKNEAEAMRNLARLYRRGLGTARSDSLALAWSLKAADAGSLEAMVDVGMMYAEGVKGRRDMDEALRWLRRAADLGSSRAMYAIGRLHEGARDFDLALGWYRMAAQAGSADAMNGLGVLYQNGWGVAADRAQASGWYRRAVKAGSPVARGNLAALEGG